MNESRASGGTERRRGSAANGNQENRTPPRERGEWGTERRRGSAASGGTERRRGSAASGNGIRKAPTPPKIQKKETRGVEV